MNKKNLNYCIITGLLLVLAGCAIRDEKYSQSNPFDPGGDNWTTNSTPKIFADIGLKPLWYDYDFQKNAGTVSSSVFAYDKNGKYDTLTIIGLLGPSSDSLDTIFAITDSALDSTICFQNLKIATTYYYKFIAIDTWDSVGVASGNFTTPNGCPPDQVDSIVVTSYSSHISLMWYGENDYTKYKLYRANNKDGPFVSILDTISSSTYVSFSDYVDDYSVYYYVIATANVYGECRSKKEISGYKYSSSVSYPSYVSASDGTYSSHIYVSWASVSGAVKYYIHRGRSATTAYSIIDSTPYTYYRDTIRDTSTRFCYRISAANSKGYRSRPSYDYDYGYVQKLSSPYNVNASDGTYDSYIYISWSSVYNAAGYYIYRTLSSSGTYTYIGSTTSTNFVDSAQTMDTYYYKVAAYDINGRAGNLSSYNTGYIKRALNQPTSVTASQGTYDDYISISWSAVANATGYYIYRSKTTDLDSFTVIDSTSSTGYNDSVPTADNYYYAIAAYDTLGRVSQKSSYAYGYLLRLSTPSISSISKGTYYNYILLNWGSVTGADGYYIYRSDNGSNDPYELIDSTDTTVYKDSSITDTIFYYYKIAAYTSTGKVSPQSSPDYGYLKRFSFPTNIVASQYDYKNKITLSWDMVPAATGYNVYRSTSSSGVYDQIATVSTNSYEDKALDTCNYYYYKVSSLKGVSETLKSAYVIGYRLGPPSNFSVKGYSGYITLSWSSINSTKVEGYYIYRSPDGNSFTRITVVSSSNISSYKDTVIDYTAYYYKISSFSLQDESDYSPVSSSQMLPERPANLTAQSYPTHVALTWDPSAGAESYNVYRGTSISGQIIIATVQQPLYNDSSLTTSTKYYYSVTAVNKGGETTKSNSTYAGIIIKPSAPLNLTASGTTEHIYLQWYQNTSDDVVGYCIYRSSDSGNTYSPIDTAFTQTFYDYATSGRLFYYKVSAYNNAGEGDKSDSVSARRFPPEAPERITIGSEQYTTHIPLTWSSSTGAAGYNIYRAVSADSSYQKFTTITATAYNDSTVLADTIYYYRISAYNIAGESELSSYVSGKKLSTQPPPLRLESYRKP